MDLLWVIWMSAESGIDALQAGHERGVGGYMAKCDITKESLNDSLRRDFGGYGWGIVGVVGRQLLLRF